MDSNSSPFLVDTLLGITMDGSLMTSAAYSNKESVGVSLLIATSSLSLIAVSGLLLLMGVAAWSNRSSKNQNYFFRSNVAAYFICLLVADLIQAIASIMNARWVQLGGVQQGHFCTTQAVLKQVSDVGSAIWSLVISAQTFFLLFYQLHLPWWVTMDSGNFYGISGYWCWITAEYEMARVTLDYLVLFLSSSLSFILYTLVFFRLRGNIVVTGWHVRFRMLEKDESGWRGRQPADSHALRVAKQMILHPIAYTILFLPIAVLRLCEFTGRPVSLPVMMLCDSIFLLGGVVDVVLFCTIRRVIPVKEVAKALFTGQIFRTGENPPTDSTWFIGTLEAGGNDIADDLSLPVDDNYFVLRQPKFEIVTLPPPAVLSNGPVMPRASKQTARLSLTVNTEAVVHTDTRSPLPRTRSIPRKPLPRDVYDRSPSVFRQGSTRKLPPVPQGPRAPTLPSVIERRETPPPPYRPITAHNHRPSASRSVSSHSHSNSLD
ncbi:hypothetical protein BJ322DRAFT_91315 [Thelephora terrestris]|uniref:G-protein coupled receptors family 1 profile domain-containing protein n=1 Tax=Thelephora terrestris TaxID=56493 RepID=A0A9P6HR92_9AGAM|nr:hypothetical protein BJ322DRAFT_91315 [Thelephora terrestris]